MYLKLTHWEILSVCSVKCYYYLDTPSETNPQIMYYQLAGHPLAQLD